MNSLTATGSGTSPAQSRRPAIAQVMRSALAPYTLVSEQLISAFGAVDDVRDLLSCNGGELFVMKNLPTDPGARWTLHCRALDALDQLPADRILVVGKTIHKAIITKPTAQQVTFLAGAMLDALGIQAGDGTDGYISALAFELAELEPTPLDQRQYGRIMPKHVPVPAIARGLRSTWQDEDASDRAKYGRPPAIWQVLKRCADARWSLCGEYSRVRSLAFARADLKRIADATADAMPPAGDDSIPW